MKIVIVEDEAPIRNGLAKMLPKLHRDYEVVGTASDGVEGLRVIEETRPDLVILDIQMPEMDGLTMLSEMRKQGIACKAVVLTAYSDFSYAKQAIELGIENYLLKPLKIPELTKTLEIVQESIEMEQGREKLFTLERMVRSSILAELPIDEDLNQITKERFGLDIHERLVLFGIGLGEEYGSYSAEAVRILKECQAHTADYKGCIIESVKNSMVLAVMFQIEDAKQLQKRFANSVAPSVVAGLGISPVLVWTECEGLEQAPEAFARLLSQREWCLNFPSGTLVSQERIEALAITPLKYPIDLESQLRSSIINRNQKEFEQSIRQFFRTCMDQPHHPDEIRDACMRYCMSIVNLAKQTGNMKETVSAQALFQSINQAYTWKRIGGIVDGLYNSVTAAPKEDAEVSLMVKRARQLIEEYYNQGLTLEETAQKLCVSEEYLSTQFKKETGASFTETVRKYRIEKVKELLLHSSLKLNQIADMVGYADPKYMSKVFKEEVGILPAEFRKSEN